MDAIGYLSTSCSHRVVRTIVWLDWVPVRKKGMNWGQYKKILFRDPYPKLEARVDSN